MSVLALMTEAFGSRGGIQEFNRHWLRALAQGDRARQVRVLVTGGPDHELDNIRQTSCRGKGAYLLEAWRHARRLKRGDLVVCGHLALLPVAAAVARRGPVPLWLQLHGIEAWEAPGVLVRRSLGSIDLACAVSRYTRRRFLQWSGIDPVRTRILPNTLREDCLEAQPDSGPAHPFRLLSVGRMDDREGYKGHDRILQALTDVVRSCPEVEYIIAGEGNDRPRLERLARTLGLHDRVRFAGAVTRSELLDLYRTSALFVMPSTGEGFGIVFLEALACGCPALGLGTDGSADPLSLPGAHAVRPDELADSVVRILGRPRHRPDRDALVRRFGPAAFRHQVGLLERRLSGAPA